MPNNLIIENVTIGLSRWSLQISSLIAVSMFAQQSSKQVMKNILIYDSNLIIHNSFITKCNKTDDK